jgi:hypothetical protein
MAIAATLASGAETTPSKPHGAMVSAATKLTREAEKTLLTVTAWNSVNPVLFSDDARRNQLFNVTSQTRRVIRSLAVLNDKNAVPFFSEYSSFANALSDLHKAVTLKTDWSPLVEETLVAATNALIALKDGTAVKNSVGPELSQIDPTPSAL